MERLLFGWILALLIGIVPILANAGAGVGCQNILKVESQNIRDTLVATQTDLLVQQLVSLQERLLPTTGYSSLNDFYLAIVNTKNPELIKNLETLESGHFDISIRAPKAARLSILEKGLHNQFVTQTSLGVLDHQARNHVEAGWTGLNFNDYSGLEPETKPKYGSLRPRPEDSSARPGNGDYAYGEDLYILKDHVRSRVGFNLGDSNTRLFENLYAFDWRNQTHTPKSWDQAYIPWKFRILLAPFLYRGNLGRPLDVFHFPIQKTWNIGSDYFEVLVFGSVQPEDIKAFEFHQEPPTGAFLKALQKYNIEIRDGRTWPPQTKTY